MARSDLPTRRRFLVYIGLAPLLVACSGATSPTAPPTNTAAPIATSGTGPGPATTTSPPVAPAPTGTTASLPPAPTLAASPAATRATSPVAASPSIASATPAGATPAAGRPPTFALQEYPIRGSAPHDVAPATDGGVWYVAQGS